MAPYLPRLLSDESPSFFDRHAPAVVNEVVIAMMDLRRKGAIEPSIIETVLPDWTDQDAHLAWEVMLARIRDGREQRIQLPLFMTVSDLRFATHRSIADWRAKRLSCNTLVEAGCGIGSQTIAFSKTCTKVIGIDTDPRKIAFAKANTQQLGITNVEFIAGDAIDILPTLSQIDNLFCEPSRPPDHQSKAGQPVSPLDSWSPNPLELIEAAGHTTPNVAIELSPASRGIPITGEWEYASIHGELTRLTVYRGSIAKATKSCVILPAGHVLTDKTPACQFPAASSCAAYVFEIDQAVVAAGLVDRIPLKGAFAVEDALAAHSSKQTLLTGNHLLSSPFFRRTFRFLAAIPNKESIPGALKKIGAKKAVIRYPVDPAQYWEERRRLEAGLLGTKTVHIFTCGGSYLLAEKIT